MVPELERSEREEIRNLVKKINRAWLDGAWAELEGYFDDDAVIKGPSFELAGRGKEACVKGYEDFARQALVRDFKSSDPGVDRWDDTAVATVPWEISYEMNGQIHHDFGHDIFVFVRQEGKWRAVWRAVLPSPKQA